jgi:type IV pilus assembly protein PilX
MKIYTLNQLHTQRGVVLVSALLLLIVMTILALYMFRTNGIQELIAGNVREKQRALATAEDAEQWAEIWLATSGNVLSNSVSCATVGLVAYNSTSVPYICTSPIASIDDAANVTTVPWTVSNSEVGFKFYPGLAATTGTGDMTVSTTGGMNAYYQVPRFYIGLLSSTATQALYRIDAWNWAGTQNTAAVVESNYLVTCSSCSVSGP